MNTATPLPAGMPGVPPPPTSKRSKALPVPAFSLYGEASQPGMELLHIEEVQSRSRLYEWEIEPHVHQGLYQVLWLQAGHASVVMDGTPDEVAGPAAIVVPPGVVHGFRFAPGTDGLVLTLSARLLMEGEFQAIGDAFRTLFAQPGVLRCTPAEQAAVRLNALFRELAAEFALPGAADAPVLVWLARSVLWRLAQASEQQQPTTVRGHRHQALFTRFLLLVEQHFLEHWPLERYASRLGLSTQRLNRLVRAESNRSALDLVHDRLTREACRRLIYMAAPAASLATELGFEDPAYFSRFIKRRTGLSPSEFRKKNRLTA